MRSDLRNHPDLPMPGGMPDARAVPGRRLALAVLASLALVLAFGVAQAGDLVTLGGAAGDAFRRWGVTTAVPAMAALVCLARAVVEPRERGAWAAIALGIGLWASGNAYYAGPLWDEATVPIPSPADAFFLAVYPCLYVGVARLVARRVRGFSRDLALDALMAALVVGAVAAAVAFEPVLARLPTPAAAAAVNLAYPLLDLVLLATATAAVALGGWRPGPSWILLAAGFVVFALADSVYLVRNVQGVWEQGTAWEAGWPFALLLIAAAAWLPPRQVDARAASPLRVAVVPLVFAVVGVAVLVADRLLELNVAVTAFATAALLVVIARLAVSFAANARLLEASRHEALTDDLTGLAGRRRLVADLAAAAARADAAPATLVLLDLNGFKDYNDRRGHLAGDELLTRLARRLESAVGDRGRAYRMGGDEFCVLATGAEPATLRTLAVSALTLVDDGVTITPAAGVARLPDEAPDPRRALQLADERMYADKRGARLGRHGATTAPGRREAEEPAAATP